MQFIYNEPENVTQEERDAVAQRVAEILLSIKIDEDKDPSKEK